MPSLRSIPQVDADLTRTTLAFKDALEQGDLDTADAMSATMDELLDRRSHTCRE